MFKPHVTVACVVHARGKFLVVEESINGKALWNQPAGHLEANETLLQAAKRELWEETGIHAEPQHFIRMHQWIAPDHTPFLRFLFSVELSETCATEPQDDEYRSLSLGHRRRDPERAKPALAAGFGKHSLLAVCWPLTAGCHRRI